MNTVNEHCPANCKWLNCRASKKDRRGLPVKYACKIAPNDFMKLHIDAETGRPIRLLGCKNGDK